MKYIKKGFLILILPLVAFTTIHKFYMSVTNVVYSEKDASLQITSRIFIDDLESVFIERYEFDAKLGTDNESTESEKYLEKYLNAKFDLAINEESSAYNFIGKKYEDDLIIIYIEVPEVQLNAIKKISLNNEILTDLYDEQQNIVHFKIKEKKKSFVLHKENSTGALNL